MPCYLGACQQACASQCRDAIQYSEKHAAFGHLKKEEDRSDDNERVEHAIAPN